MCLLSGIQSEQSLQFSFGQEEERTVRQTQSGSRDQPLYLASLGLLERRGILTVQRVG